MISVDFCKSITDSLARRGDVFRASLQAGSCERKSEGLLQLAMQMWLDRKQPDLICLTEHKKVDFVWVSRRSVGSDELAVRAGIEVKFNFANQGSYLKNRPRETLDQLRRHKKSLKNIDEIYLLYFLVHVDRGDRWADPGWKHAGQHGDQSFTRGVEALKKAAGENLSLLHGADGRVEEWFVSAQLFKFREVTAAVSSFGQPRPALLDTNQPG